MPGKNNRYNDLMENESTTEEGNTTFKYAGFLPIPAVLSLILFLVGFVTPGWACVEILGQYVGSGLWYNYVCGARSDCEIKWFPSQQVKSKDLADALENYMVKYRVMASLALVFQIFATISALLAIIPKTNLKQYLFTFICICNFCLFLSAIFSLVTSGMYAHELIKSMTVFKKYEHILGKSPYTFPYSLFVFGIGGIISALTMFFIMGTVFIKRLTVNGPIGSTFQMS
ncbi:uncharacterized protein LOC128231959 [Mya arenaria]|uniref:uncharacterized protein LOC128231959 n=1 Tax=Mya arenaria TaxID=6604 RepID=UPI0022E0416E|nr:uncharacterized protein LOC128231959 [Mya arenaria]